MSKTEAKVSGVMRPESEVAYPNLVLAIDQVPMTDILHIGKDALSMAGCVMVTDHLVHQFLPMLQDPAQRRGAGPLLSPPPRRYGPQVQAFSTLHRQGARQIFYDARLAQVNAANMAAEVRDRCCELPPYVTPPKYISVMYGIGRKSIDAAVQATRGTSEIVALVSSSDLDADDYLDNFKLTAANTALRFSKIAASAGVRAIMCAAADARFIRLDEEKRGIPPSKRFKIFGTGIRLEGDEQLDQKRVVTPKKAIQNGVDYLVVGTPITKARQKREQLNAYGEAFKYRSRRSLSAVNTVE